jgi:hypothetical protein
LSTNKLKDINGGRTNPAKALKSKKASHHQQLGFAILPSISEASFQQQEFPKGVSSLL